MNKLLFDTPKSIELVKEEYDITKLSILTTPNLFPLVKGIEYNDALPLQKRYFPIKRKMDVAIANYENAMLLEWEKAKKKLDRIKNKIKGMRKMDYNNTQTIDRICRIPFRYKKEFVQASDKYGLNLAILDRIVLNPSLLVNARYDNRKNLMELNPDYLKQHGMIRIGDSGEVISEIDKTFIHEFGHAFWYNSLTEEDRQAWGKYSRFYTREQLTGDMSQYLVGEKKRFDGSTAYSPFYTQRDDRFVSVYARFNQREDFAECFLYYKVAPKTLERIDPNKYAFMEAKVGQRIEKDIKKQDLTSEEQELADEFIPDVQDRHLTRDTIIVILYALKDRLSYTAKQHITQAYQLGQQKGSYYARSIYEDKLTDIDKEKIQQMVASNDQYLDGFMDTLVDDYDNVLFNKTPTGMIESEKAYEDIDEFDSEFSDVLNTKEHRLGVYAIAGLGLALSEGMVGELEGEFAGGFWHTTNDGRVCEGCERLDGMWMSFDEFDTLYLHNECDGNCRCGELFEPALAPER